MKGSYADEIDEILHFHLLFTNKWFQFTHQSYKKNIFVIHCVMIHTKESKFKEVKKMKNDTICRRRGNNTRDLLNYSCNNSQRFRSFWIRMIFDEKEWHMSKIKQNNQSNLN